MAALKCITAHLKRQIRYLETRSAPLVLEHGIKTMPDEVLAHVFEAGHQISEHSQFALRVSHVSRRFRQVSFQTPLLWTRLSSRHPNNQIQAFTPRPGLLDLEVTLFHGSINTKGELRSRLQLMALHSHRWSRLSLCAGQGQIGLEIMDEVGLTSLPRLRYLYQNYNARRLKWDMPLLSQFYGFCMFHLTMLDFCHN
ncbi:hypothetical protein BD410DRAFT_86793 [Rickenella mellea]|uniref:F-box domain-containing protein n=1 Tax=Rickenella mellea TaxID=50990 RepID=A0A4Y7PL51_9AGAM|nr:hypothetical protein BD410DRAFT_86793 [Rickenella mellea]